MIFYKKPVSIQHQIALFCIFALGVALRIYAWYTGEGYLYYAINDEIVAYRYALGFLAGEEHTLYLGQPAFAAGQAPGPFWTLFWVGLLKLGNGSVHYALLWMTLFNSLAIYLFYRLARHFAPAGLTLFATLFFALSPWTIYYSTGMWNPLPLMVIGGLLFLALWHVLNQEQSRRIFWVCVLVAVVPQFHMIGVFYIPVILLLLYLSPAPINKKWLMLGIVAGIAIYLPYLVGELQHDFANTRSMLSGTDKPTFGVLKILTAPLTMLTSIPAGWAGRDFSATVAYANTWFGSIYILLLFCLLSLAYAGTAYFSFLKNAFLLIKQHWQQPRHAINQQLPLVFLTSLSVFPLLLFLLTRHDYATRYTLLIFPLLFLIPVLFFQSIKSAWFKKLFGVTTIIILSFNIYLTLSFFAWQGDMIRDDTKFAPSFRSLEILANDLYSQVGEEKRIKIQLSDMIQALPQGDRKIAVGLAEYFDIIDQYKIGNLRPRDYVQLKISLTDEKAEISATAIFYEANGLIFTVTGQL